MTMYKRSQIWLEEAGEDSVLKKLRKLRHTERVSLCHINYEIDRIHRWWSALEAERSRVLAKYHSIDLQLAEIDGRLLFIKDVPKLTKLETDTSKILKKLSAEERSALIEELKNL